MHFFFRQPATTSFPGRGRATAPFYIGLQAARLRFAGLGQYDANGQPLSFRGPMPVAGYRFNKRMSVEIGIMWRSKADGPVTTVNYRNGGLYRHHDSYESRVVPLVLRYSLWPRAQHWDVQGVIGFALLHHFIQGNRSMTEPGQSLQPYSVGGFTEANDLLLLLGAAFSYAVAPHWTLVGEGRIHWSLFGSAAGLLLFNGVFLPQSGLSAGIRYNFRFANAPVAR